MEDSSCATRARASRASSCIAAVSLLDSPERATPSLELARSVSNSEMRSLSVCFSISNFSLSSRSTFFIARASVCAFCSNSSNASSSTSPPLPSVLARARESSAFSSSICAVIWLQTVAARCRISSFSPCAASAAFFSSAFAFACLRISPFSAACARSSA